MGRNGQQQHPSYGVRWHGPSRPRPTNFRPGPGVWLAELNSLGYDSGRIRVFWKDVYSHLP
ncbi:hypothetical protein SAMN04489832_0725 [Micromonospora cremea]|uniref:Uncharacterized protein n=1 Tax=Micromonospora cremea TaxID=709881 RepID=A0A1N5U956_9ACTN|nr:hypothetical protein SAMN04489832_0725 [Micromonospora cremea]